MFSLSDVLSLELCEFFPDRGISSLECRESVSGCIHWDCYCAVLNLFACLNVLAGPQWKESPVDISRDCVNVFFSDISKEVLCWEVCSEVVLRSCGKKKLAR